MISALIKRAYFFNTRLFPKSNFINGLIYSNPKSIENFNRTVSIWANKYTPIDDYCYLIKRDYSSKNDCYYES